MPLHYSLGDRMTACLLKKKKKSCRVGYRGLLHYSVWVWVEIFQRRSFKIIITEKPTEYTARISEIEILKVVQIMGAENK